MKTIVTGALFADEQDMETLRRCGLDITLHPDERQPVVHPEQYEVAICNNLFSFHDIASFSRLRYIQLTSAGCDRVPLDYIRAHNITLHTARGVYSVPMAEHAVAGVLQLYKQSRFFLENQTQHRWEKHRGLMELGGKTVCVVGCGSVGTACAQRFAAFGCRVIGVDIAPRKDDAFVEIQPLPQLHNALTSADVVILTLPLTTDTRHLFDRAAFEAIKPGAVLVNIARGAVVDTAALRWALEAHLYGAVLDVFEEEPLSPEDPLWDHKHVILTPHNSFVGEHNHRRMMELVLQNLSDLGEG